VGDLDSFSERVFSALARRIAEERGIDGLADVSPQTASDTPGAVRSVMPRSRAAPPATDPRPEARSEPVMDENVQFTVYRPRSVRPQKWYPLLAFAHLDELPEDHRVRMLHTADQIVEARVMPLERIGTAHGSRALS